MTKRFLVGAAMAGVLLMGVAACGSDDSGAPATVLGSASAPASAGATKVDPQEGAALIAEKGAALTVIDVRTADEFAAGHLEHAVNMDIEGGQFSALIAPLPKDGQYMVYCHSGRRSAIAAQAMIDAGFTNVYDLGGIADWQAAGLPVVTG